jgi:hypothetical protein
LVARTSKEEQGMLNAEAIQGVSVKVFHTPVFHPDIGGLKASSSDHIGFINIPMWNVKSPLSSYGLIAKRQTANQ